MNKKTNTVLFILGATVFNLLIIMLLMVLSLLIIGLLSQGNISPALLSILMMVLFLGSIAGAFFIYSWLVRLLSRKIDLEKYFLPLFRKKK